MQTEQHVSWHSLPIDRLAEVMEEAVDIASAAVQERVEMGDKDASLTDYFHIVTTGLTGVLGDDMGATLCALAGPQGDGQSDEVIKRTHAYFQRAFQEVFELLLGDYQALRAGVELPILGEKHAEIRREIYGNG